MKIRKCTGRAFLLMLWILVAIVAVDPYIPQSCIIWTDGSCRAATVPIFYVDARDKGGTEIGIALGGSVKAAFPNIEQKMDAYLVQFIGQIAY